MTDGVSVHDRLLETLGEAQRLGFLGAGSLRTAVERAQRFSRAIPEGVDDLIDVGSGGGVPGLVVAIDRPEIRVTLLDRRERRTDFLSRAVSRLALGEHVRVICSDAARLARHEDHRARYGAALARGLGPPPVTAELCRGFVVAGGVILVAEPPPGSGVNGGHRWPADGLQRAALIRQDSGVPGIAVLEAVGECPPSLPRKRQEPPLW